MNLPMKQVNFGMNEYTVYSDCYYTEKSRKVYHRLMKSDIFSRKIRTKYILPYTLEINKNAELTTMLDQYYGYFPRFVKQFEEIIYEDDKYIIKVLGYKL